MHSLALARYRFLTTIRQRRWVAPVLTVALFPSLVGGGGLTLFKSDLEFAWDAPEALKSAALGMLFGWAIHLIAISTLGWSLGIAPREQTHQIDLLDTAPISGRTQFFGDTLGIFAFVFAMHICCVPVLAELVAISPFPPILFLWLEIATIALLLMVSAAAAWSLRTDRSGWRQKRSTVNALLFLILFVGVVTVTTRIDDFYFGMAGFFEKPSPQRWQPVMASIVSMPLLLILLLALYGSFIAFFAADTARTIEKT